MNYITDTHPLIWWFINSPKISPTAKTLFDQCERGENVILIPSIVIAESLSIFDKKKVSFDFKQLFESIRECENYVLIPLNQKVLQRMVETKEVTELHDKIIVATAKILEVPLITKDSHLHTLKTIKTIW